jgi:tetratricopeptide (TPR) repeat protein
LERLKTHQFGPRHQSYSLLRLYQSVQLLKAYQLASSGSYEPALRHLAEAENTPINLGIDDFVTLKSSRLLLFEALVHRAAGSTGEMEAAWKEAIETVDHDYNGQGLFRAIALASMGRSEEAENWFERSEMVNRQRQKDNTARVRTEAFYLAGIYSVFRGDEEAGRGHFEKSMRADEGNLFARHAQLWLDAGLFEGISGAD